MTLLLYSVSLRSLQIPVFDHGILVQYLCHQNVQPPSIPPLLRGTLPYIPKNIIKTMNSIFGFGQ